MTTTTESRSAFQRMNEHTFSNARKNALAVKKMSMAERLTGMTVEELAEQQRQMRASFYSRQVSA